MRIRFAPTYVGRDDLRHLMRGNCGGNSHFDTREEAQAWLDAVLAGNSVDRTRELYGDRAAMGVSWILCWDHGECVGAYAEDPDQDPPSIEDACVAWCGHPSPDRPVCPITPDAAATYWNAVDHARRLGRAEPAADAGLPDEVLHSLRCAAAIVRAATGAPIGCYGILTILRANAPVLRTTFGVARLIVADSAGPQYPRGRLTFDLTPRRYDRDTITGWTWSEDPAP